MQPRVLVLTTYYHPVVGGVETHSRQLVNYLSNRGFEVQVITKRVSGSQRRDDLVDGVPVHRVGPAGDRHASGKWIALPFFLSKVIELRQRFNVIVCIDYRGIGVSAVSAGGILRRPVIVQSGTAGVLAPPSADMESGVPRESLVVRLLKWPARSVYRRADHFVCIGHDIEQEALSAGVPRQRVHYLPHGVDLERFRPGTDVERMAIRAANGWPADYRVVLFVGRLSVEKGIVDLIEAWTLVDDKRALLVVVGPDMPAHPWDAGPVVRALIEKSGARGPGRRSSGEPGRVGPQAGMNDDVDLSSRVRLHGPAVDTAPLYRAADVFVQPSHFEGFGISAIEAMASGVPVVASRVGGLRDFLVDGENALLHEPRSPASIAQALTRLLTNASERSRLANAGLRTVRERFDEGTLLASYVELIRSAVEASSGERSAVEGP